MESQSPQILYTELSEPKRRLLRSDAALYAVLLAGAIGCIALSRVLAARFGTMRLVFQIWLYAALFLGGYFVYRFRMVAFRYTLTPEGLTVHQSVGSRTTLLVSVPYDAIESVGPWQDGAGSFDGRTFIGKRADALCVLYRAGEERHALCLSASDRLRELLEERLHA